MLNAVSPTPHTNLSQVVLSNKYCLHSIILIGLSINWEQCSSYYYALLSFTIPWEHWPF